MGRMSLELIWSTRWKKKMKKKKKKKSKAMRRIQRGEDLVAPEIPLDLHIEILTRLPVKSLTRFRCVSKLWSSYIRSRFCSRGYLTVASPPRLYISLVEEHGNCGLMEEVCHCHNPGKSLLLSLSLASSKSAFDLDLTMQGIGGHNMVVLRGLILYTVCRQACIYNPTTGQSVTLPAIKFNIFAAAEEEEEKIEQRDYFLGYDPVLNQYKVVCTAVVGSVDLERIDAQHWVFVLEAGGSWKKIEFDQPHLPTRLGLCINGVIYYLASSYLSRDNVIGFDVRSEEFIMIQAPHEVSEFAEYVGFIEYGGKPTLFDYTHMWAGSSGLVNLWVLEDAGKWSRMSLVLQPCQRHLVPSSFAFKVIGSTQNSEVILQPRLMPSPGYILYYDLHKNDLRRVDIRGISEDHKLDNEWNFHCTLMDTGESIMRLET